MPKPSLSFASLLMVILNGCATTKQSTFTDRSISDKDELFVLIMGRAIVILGIVSGIFPRDHSPPHFHAVYGEYKSRLRFRVE
jgi:hypothetical protein